MRVKWFSIADQPWFYQPWDNRIARLRPSTAHGFRAPVQALDQPTGWTVQLLADEAIATGLTNLAREGPTQLILTVTEACNLRCRYCAYSGAYRYGRTHDNRHMSLHTALKAVTWYLRFARPTYRIGFYGGEPLLRFDLIRQVIEQAERQRPPDAVLHFSITTNGLLLTDAQIDFLAQAGVDLFISLDGPARIHDRYRRGADDAPTFVRVWDRLRRIAVRQPAYFARQVNVSMTLAPPIAMDELDGFIAANQAIFAGKVPKIGWLHSGPSDLDQRLGIEQPQPDPTTALRQRYLDDLINGRPPSALARACVEPTFVRIHRRNMAPSARLVTSGGQCIPGNRCHVTPDERLHMCEHADLQLSIGSLDEGFDLPQIGALLRRYRALMAPRCSTCWAVRLCRTCIVTVAAGSRLATDQLDKRCAAIRSALARDLRDYCRARAVRPDCFDSLATTSDALP